MSGRHSYLGHPSGGGGGGSGGWPLTFNHANFQKPPIDQWLCPNPRCQSDWKAFDHTDQHSKRSKQCSCGTMRSASGQYWHCYNQKCKPFTTQWLNTSGWINPVEESVCLKCKQTRTEAPAPKIKEKPLIQTDEDGHAAVLQRKLTAKESLSFIRFTLSDLTRYPDGVYTLNMSDCSLRDEGIKALCTDILPALKGLRQLYLSKCEFGAAGAESLGRFLVDTERCNLELLDISGNESLHRTISSTRRPPPQPVAVSMALADMGKRPSTATATATAAAPPPSLLPTVEAVPLYGSDFIADALKVNRTLRRLVCHNCGPVSGSTFFPLFTEALAVNSSLLSVWLSTGNDYLTSCEFQMMAAAIKQNTNIAYVHVRSLLRPLMIMMVVCRRCVV